MNNRIKSFSEYNNEDCLVEGVNLRTASAVALLSKSNSLSKQIDRIKTQDADLDKKLNLISKQLLYNSALVAQLGIMKKR